MHPDRVTEAGEFNHVTEFLQLCQVIQCGLALRFYSKCRTYEQYLPDKVALPQDSDAQNCIKNLATSTMQELSSITIMPPEPIKVPRCLKRFVIDGGIQIRLGNTTAGRTACLHSFKLMPFWYTATNIKYNFTQSGAKRYFNQSCIFDSTTECESFCAFTLFGTDFGKPFRYRCEL